MNKADWRSVVLVAILLALSFPPFPGGFLVPFTLAFFIHTILHRPDSRTFLMGYLKGVIWGALTLFWIGNNTIPGAVMTILVNALHYGFIWWIFRRIYNFFPRLALLSFPILWVAVEQLRHFTDIRFNWLNLAYTQTYYLPFIQFIEWTGYLGLSFLLVTLAVWLYLIIYRHKRHPAFLAMGLVLILLPWGYGQWRLQQLESKTYPALKVGVIQPNVDPYRKWDAAFQDSAFAMLREMTLTMQKERPQLVLWPETATPFFLRYEENYLSHVYALVDTLNSYLITGTPDYQFIPSSRAYRTYNAAFFFAPGWRMLQHYYKMALVPAAESMPFKQYLPFLRRIDVGGGDYFPGTEFKVFWMQPEVQPGIYLQHRFRLAEDTTAVSMRIGVSAVICYESIFPHLVRQFVQNGARLLTIITNDGWFGTTSGPYQHAQYAIFRAVENRVSIARSANTGISRLIEPTGRVQTELGLNQKGVLLGYLPVQHTTTFYTRHGDWFGYLNLVLTLLILSGGHIARMVGEKRQR